MTVAEPQRIAIVGAGPAGLATARAYRECGGEAALTLIGEETALPYKRPPLTKQLLRGELAAEELSIEDQGWFDTNSVAVRLGAPVTEIDATGGSVTVAGEQLRADVIVLATGSEPLRPPIPGADDERVLTMRRLPDALAVSERLEERATVAVIGTGFIGCEIAASLAMRGAHVSLIGEEALPQAARLGADAGAQIAAWLGELDVTMIGGAGVAAIRDGQRVELQDGREIECSLVVLATGVRPRGELAEAAGLVLRDGAVEVDDAMRSSSASGRVRAVGDVARAFNATASRSLRVEHWGDALGHGEVAGRSLAGRDAHWEDVPGFWSEIGGHTLKHAAWGDGFDEARASRDSAGGLTVWYGRGGVTVGVLTHARDADYERGRELIARGAPLP